MFLKPMPMKKSLISYHFHPLSCQIGQCLHSLPAPFGQSPSQRLQGRRHTSRHCYGKHRDGRSLNI